MMWRCKWCGYPIKKFLVGWVHVNDAFPFVPTTLHVAQPRRRP